MHAQLAEKVHRYLYLNNIFSWIKTKNVLRRIKIEQ